MKVVRSNLTRLKSEVEKSLPDEADILGFPGINKTLILEMLSDSHELSYTLSGLEPKSEVTLLKRKISRLLEECKNLLDDGFSGYKKEENFDRFLTNLTRIRDDIRMTYLVVIDKALRTEQERNAILENYELLSAAYKQYETQYTQIADNHKRIVEAAEAATRSVSQMEEFLTVTKQAAEEVTTLQTAAQTSFEVTSKYETEIKEIRQSVTDLSATLGSLESQAQNLIEEMKVSKSDTGNLIKTLSDQLALNASHQQDIQDTLDNANRMGMAGSFKSRKDELDWPIRVWNGVFVLAVITIFAVSSYFISPYFSGAKTFNYVEVLLKVALVAPFVWLAWMSVKQYGYLSRIREDYAYKYASAMAFEGYKKHAKEIDDDLLRNLLAVSVLNLSQNPIRLYRSSDNHGSPGNEFLAELKSILKLGKDYFGKTVINRDNARTEMPE